MSNGISHGFFGIGSSLDGDPEIAGGDYFDVSAGGSNSFIYLEDSNTGLELKTSKCSIDEVYQKLEELTKKLDEQEKRSKNIEKLLQTIVNKLSVSDWQQETEEEIF
jgi:hypothetical protein